MSDATSAAAPRSAPTTESERRRSLSRIIRAFDSRITRWYSRVRFLIIRQEFLESVGQYLPKNGDVLDIGCGFGLFALYFAGAEPGRRVWGYDLDRKRVDMAAEAARRLRLENAHFEFGDATDLTLGRRYDGAYALDIIHHLPQDLVPSFLAKVHEMVQPGGRFIIKDVEDRPFHKRWFTLILDRLMVGFREPIRYWPREELVALLRKVGFEVYAHQMRDILPYPHIMYVCRKAPTDGPA